jgi:septum formation protein
MFKNHKIILASGSPRRQKFLSDMNIPFEVRLKEVDENYPEILTADAITDYIAIQKANAYDLAENELLITSDTIVWLENEAIGKPENYNDAFQILKRLSNKTHTVFTSVCFKTFDNLHTINDKTDVTFGDLSDEMIHYYLENFKPFDKAGAYGIQEWIGAVGVIKIEGSYNNIVGFPTQKVYEYLMEL